MTALTMLLMSICVHLQRRDDIHLAFIRLASVNTASYGIVFLRLPSTTSHSLKIFAVARQFSMLCSAVVSTFIMLNTPPSPADSFSCPKKVKPELIYPLYNDSCDLIRAYMLSYTCHSVLYYIAVTQR